MERKTKNCRSKKVLECDWYSEATLNKCKIGKFNFIENVVERKRKCIGNKGNEKHSLSANVMTLVVRTGSTGTPWMTMASRMV